MGTESNDNSFYMENGMGMENFYSVQSMLGNANNSPASNNNNNNGNNTNSVLVNSNSNGSGNRWGNLLAPRDTNEQQHQQIHNTTANICNNFASHQRNFLNYGNMACYQRIYNENGFPLTANAQNYHQYPNNTQHYPHPHQQQKQHYSLGLRKLFFYSVCLQKLMFKLKKNFFHNKTISRSDTELIYRINFF